mgnify:CR=1 FL=1
MARPLYPHELGDPDFSWLISNFQEHNVDYVCVDTSPLPVVFLPGTMPTQAVAGAKEKDVQLLFEHDDDEEKELNDVSE